MRKCRKIVFMLVIALVLPFIQNMAAQASITDDGFVDATFTRRTHNLSEVNALNPHVKVKWVGYIRSDIDKVCYLHLEFSFDDSFSNFSDTEEIKCKRVANIRWPEKVIKVPDTLFGKKVYSVGLGRSMPFHDSKIGYFSTDREYKFDMEKYFPISEYQEWLDFFGEDLRPQTNYGGDKDGFYFSLSDDIVPFIDGIDVDMRECTELKSIGDGHCFIDDAYIPRTKNIYLSDATDFCGISEYFLAEGLRDGDKGIYTNNANVDFRTTNSCEYTNDVAYKNSTEEWISEAYVSSKDEMYSRLNKYFTEKTMYRALYGDSYLNYMYPQLKFREYSRTIHAPNDSLIKACYGTDASKYYVSNGINTQFVFLNANGGSFEYIRYIHNQDRYRNFTKTQYVYAYTGSDFSKYKHMSKLDYIPKSDSGLIFKGYCDNSGAMIYDENGEQISGNISSGTTSLKAVWYDPTKTPEPTVAPTKAPSAPPSTNYGGGGSGSGSDSGRGGSGSGSSSSGGYSAPVPTNKPETTTKPVATVKPSATPNAFATPSAVPTITPEATQTPVPTVTPEIEASPLPATVPAEEAPAATSEPATEPDGKPATDTKTPDSITKKGITYSIHGDKAYVSQVTNKALDDKGEATIPAVVKVNDKTLHVTKILKGAFKKATKVKSITLSCKYLVKIEKNAFSSKSAKSAKITYKGTKAQKAKVKQLVTSSGRNA